MTFSTHATGRFQFITKTMFRGREWCNLLKNMLNTDKVPLVGHTFSYFEKIWSTCACLISKEFVIILEDKDCSLYLGFDRYNAAQLFDDSENNNKATLENGATVTKVDGSCGMCAKLLDGEVVFDGKNFKGLPRDGITIALMINLENTIGSHEIFQTVGDHSDHTEGQYHLETIDGKIRWFHRNEKGETVFSAETSNDIIKPKHWYEIVVTYSAEGVSRIFCDSIQIREETSDQMSLSQDWGAFAGIGNFKGDRELKGYIDEFYIFKRTLNQSEIREIHEHCKGSKANKILALNFENITGNETLDTTYQGNNGYFTGQFFKGLNGTCGHDVSLPPSINQSNEISILGSRFRNKPTDACTIAMWIKLEDNKGIHKLFYTLGGHSMHTHEQYDFSVHDGAIYWIHRNEYDQQIFNVNTEPIIVKAEWTHVAATYNSTKEIAVIYVNGEIKEGKNGAGALSEDWDGIAAIGRHNGGSLDSFDEIEIYDRELSPLEIRQLFMKCSDVLPYGMRSTIPLKHHQKKIDKVDEKLVRRKRDLEHQAQLVYMTFDRIGGDKVFDDSGYGNVGHLIGMSKLARDVGKCGHGLRFQGGNILLNGHLMRNKPKDGITIALWVYMDSTDGQQEIFQTIDPKASANKHGMFYLEANDGHIRWFHRNEQSETIFSIETKEKILQPEVWLHIGVTYDVNTKKAALYANGKLIQSDEGTGALSQDWEGRVSIGKFYDTSETGDYLEGRAFQGILDELFIYNRALTQIEISRLSQICDFRRVVLYYSFDKIKGDLIYDQSGLANFGHIVNGSEIIDGYCGAGLNFTSEGYIELHGDEFRMKPANAISISVWIRLNTNRGRHQLFNTIGSRSLHKHDQYDFAVLDGQVVWFHRDHLGKTVFDITTLAVVRPRQWVNLIVTYDSQEGKAQFFLDGQLVKEAEGNGYLSQDWGHYAGIGKHYYENRYFSGAVDELTIFNYALPNDEIQYVAKGQCDSSVR